jgi:hypothetical protein
LTFPCGNLGNVYSNLNQVYMAGLMTAPMVVIELVLMGSMYERRKLNAVLIAASLVALVALWLFIRQQREIDQMTAMLRELEK